MEIPHRESVGQYAPPPLSPGWSWCLISRCPAASCPRHRPPRGGGSHTARRAPPPGLRAPSPPPTDHRDPQTTKRHHVPSAQSARDAGLRGRAGRPHLRTKAQDPCLTLRSGVHISVPSALCVCVRGEGVGTRPGYLMVCLWRRPLASRLSGGGEGGLHWTLGLGSETVAGH